MNSSRRAFIGGLSATAAVCGGVTTASANPSGPRPIERIEVPGFFGDGTKMFCLANRSFSQMLSTVFVSKTGHVAVIDGGEYADGAFLGEFLQQLGGTVDHWFITHAHSDHHGALSAMMESGVAKKLKIKELVFSFADLAWYAKWENASLKHIERFLRNLANYRGSIPVRRYVTGERIVLDGGVAFEVLNDMDEKITHNAINNSSICQTVTIAGKRILVTGDLGVEGGERLVALLGPQRIRHDILFMPHHGQSATKKSFFEQVKPSVAIWPATDWIWDNARMKIGPLFSPGSGDLTTNYYKCYLQEIGVRQQFVLTRDIVLS